MKKFRVYILAAIAAALVPCVSFAELVITAENTTIPFSVENQTGSLEVFVQSDEGTPPDLLDWQVVLSLSDPGINFTGASKTIDHPYVLPVNGQFFSAEVRDAGSKIKGLDSGFLTPEPLDNGDGLLRVDFEIGGGTPAGTYDVLISTAPNDTFLTGTGGDFAISTLDGTITISPDPFPVPLFSEGATYRQNFDAALRNGDVGHPLPTGWFADNNGVINDSITQAFPAANVVSGTYNAGDGDDRTLATGNGGSSEANSLQFVGEITGGRIARAVRLEYTVEAWGGDPAADDPGEAAYNVTLEADEGNGFALINDFGPTTTGTVLAPGAIDGNVDPNRAHYDSGIVELNIKNHSEFHLNFEGKDQGSTGGYIYGLDDVTFRTLAPGDTDGDGTIDPFDINRILAADKFGKGPSEATWQEGDFDQNDKVDPFDINMIIRALITFPQTFAAEAGTPGDGVPDVIINPATGNITVDTNDVVIGSIVIDSAAGIFNGPNSPSWDAPGDFAADIDSQISMPISFTNPGYVGIDDLGDGIIGDVPPGFDFLADLTVSYLDPNGDLLDGNVIVPEPSSIVLLGLGSLALFIAYRRRR